jgi:hypothetical protein
VTADGWGGPRRKRRSLVHGGDSHIMRKPNTEEEAKVSDRTWQPTEIRLLREFKREREREREIRSRGRPREFQPGPDLSLLFHSSSPPPAVWSFSCLVSFRPFSSGPGTEQNAYLCICPILSVRGFVPTPIRRSHQLNAVTVVQRDLSLGSRMVVGGGGRGSERRARHIKLRRSTEACLDVFFSSHSTTFQAIHF